MDGYVTNVHLRAAVCCKTDRWSVYIQMITPHTWTLDQSQRRTQEGGGVVELKKKKRERFDIMN